MKKIILIIFISFFSTASFSEMTSFGFSVNAPTHYKFYKNMNLGQLMKMYRGDKIDKNYTEKEMKDLGLQTNQMFMDFLVSERFDYTKNSINISADKSEPMNIDQMGSSEIKMVCLYMKDFYQNAYKNPSHKQYSCSKSNQLSFTSLKMVHDGTHKQLNDRLIQFLIEHKRYGSITLTLGCEIKHCYEMEADLVRIGNSIR